MYPAGGRSLRSVSAGYGLPGGTGPGAYPLGGMHTGGSFGGIPPQHVKQWDISFDTSSKDPLLMRARVFVGNMNTNLISREDIIRLFSSYGTLLGVTVFKGYAFIQFSNANEADMSINALNTYNWNGSVLDVKLAITGMKSHDTAASETSSNGIKRMASGGWPGENSAVKKERTDDYGTSANIAAQSERNRVAAIGDATRAADLYQSGMPDTLICGGCRFVTSDFEQFREHRKAPCSTMGRPDDADVKWQCSMCGDVSVTAHSLLQHAFDRHNVRVLKEGTD